MGKSPGRWIKTVLFGKKHSKSYSSKNVAPDKKASENALVEDVTPNSPAISADKGAENMELDKGTSGSPSRTVTSLDLQSNFVSVPMSDDEMRIRDQAATKAQAVFRGFLARRAYRTLKGIIRLQALIRGHLVRRQAVSTLRCMQAIVRFQAVARGRRIRLSGTRAEVRKMHNVGELQVDIGANSMFGSEKLARNAYIRKLLLSLSTAMSLSLHYDSAEPNSAWNWLDRWSLSQFWKTSANPRKVSNKMPRRKQRGPQIVENEAGKAKRSIRKASTASNGDNGALASFEMDKPKRNSKKVTSHQSAENQPQNELERVKCGLRNVSASVAVASEKSKMELEKPLQQLSVGTVLKSAKSDVSEQEMVISAENTDDGLIDKRASLEGPSTTMSIDEPFDDQPQKMETTIFKEKSNSLEDERMRKRRSLPAKQEYPENISLNTPRLPSYMAATESAKAKLRASKLSEDGEEPGYVRRHSLPASSNGKLSSVSARTREPEQTNGKGSNKTNRSMMSSRDDKVLQLGWRR